jgi:hypothetical protein
LQHTLKSSRVGLRYEMSVTRNNFAVPSRMIMNWQGSIQKA